MIRTYGSNYETRSPAGYRLSPDPGAVLPAYPEDRLRSSIAYEK